MIGKSKIEVIYLILSGLIFTQRTIIFINFYFNHYGSVIFVVLLLN